MVVTLIAEKLSKKPFANVNGAIKNALVGKNAENQEEIDQIMFDLDGTENKSSLTAQTQFWLYLWRLPKP